MLIFLSYFIFLLILLLRTKSVSLMMIMIQIVSITGLFFINQNYPIVSFQTVFNLMFTMLVLSLVIAPWTKIRGIYGFSAINENKIKKITYALLCINFFVFIVFSITSYMVIHLVEDINEFKYAEGVSVEFYYSLPFSIKPLIISNFIYPTSYFLIPLHFYYLSKRKVGLSALCFLFSLNSILFGMTFFSRSVYVHYLLIYSALFWIFFGTLSNPYKKILRRIFTSGAVLIMIYFFSISIARFSEDKLYEDTIPKESYVQDPVIYSLFDYLSQWYINGLTVLDEYDFEGFNGQISFQPILGVLGQYGFINYSPENYTKQRQQLWPEHWYTFNGLVAYLVYDFGYMLTMVFCLFYYFMVIRCRPRDGIISLENCFLIVLLIQLPLMSIFYSTLSSVIFASLFLIPIFIYLKSSFRPHRT